MSRNITVIVLFMIVGTICGQDERIVRVGEDGIRASASKIVMPQYPESSRKKRVQGVAVAELVYSGNGDVTNVKVLESPDNDVRQAVIDAIKQWKFRPSTIKGKPLSVRGKLTFYFTIDRRGQPSVRNPKYFQ